VSPRRLPIRWTPRALARLAVVTVVLSGTLASGASAAVPGVDVIAQRGFGNTHNSYAWGMAWFKGALYVGTGRYVQCMEAATTDFYFPVAKTYKAYKAPSLHCPKNRWDMDLRAEIWKWSPGPRTWQRVYRSPTVVNPEAKGKRIARDIAYRGMSVRKDARGHEALFVSGVSPNEIVPELRRTGAPRLLRTFDGKHFHDIAHTFVVNKTGQQNDQRVMGYRGLTWWHGRLFAMASTGYAGDGSVFEIRDPWRRHGPSRVRQVTPPWMHVFEMETFDGHLYIGAGSSKKGYSVWKAERDVAPYRLKPIITDGAGRGPKMTGVIAMHVFGGHLYVSAVSWYATDDIPTTEMVRIARSGTWEVVVGRPRVAHDHKYRYPISGLMDGFENVFMPHIWRIADQNGALYAGTLDWSYLLQNSKTWPPDDKPTNDQFAGLLSQVLAGELGFDVWSSCDGRDWFPATRTSFSGDEYDFGVRTMVPADHKLYIGTADHAHGTRIFESDANDCESFPRGSTRSSPAAVRPNQLLTDVQRDGTVLSWEPGPTPARYEVVRSSPTAFPLSFSPVATDPDGFTFDGQLPQLVAPGTPGSSSVDVPLPGRTQVVGTTTSASFVDRTAVPGAQYTYAVIAHGPDGLRASSNFQAVPDPRPVASFAALRRALPAVRGTAGLAGDEAALSGGPGRAAALARVRQLERTAPDDTARDVARRLARRLQYAGVAGGPVGGR
jgi:hypothetical protein